MHVGIIGAGIAGLTTAWMLAEEDGIDVDSITLFEGQDRLGGHAESIPTGKGWVDLGAQHLAPSAFPVHMRLLRRFGLDEDLVECPLSVTVSADASTGPVVVTPHPARRPQPRGPAGGANLELLGAFLARATEVESSEEAWRVPAEEVIEPLDSPVWLKRDVLYPLLSSFVGCPVEDAPALSVRAAVAFLTRNAPTDPTRPPPWCNLAGGLGRLADALAGDLGRTEIRRGVPVTRIETHDDGYTIIDARGQTCTVDQIVFAAAPQDVAPLLHGSGKEARLAAVLRRFHFVRAVLGAHRDPAYMPADPACWSTNNITVVEGADGSRWAETSTWYGPITGHDLFKSWITHREREPEELLARHEYGHPVPTVDQIDAQCELRALQGIAGLHCVGSWTEDVDSQESAVRSALATAQRLAPRARRVRDLGAQFCTSEAQDHEQL